MAAAGSGQNIEEMLEGVKQFGLNTAKAVDFSSATSVALPAGATLGSGSALTAPVITGGLTASGSASNDFSASTGTFKTSSGAFTSASSSFILTNASANALTVGAAGATTPALNVDASAGSAVTGLNIAAAATGSGVTVTALGGTNEYLILKGKGNRGVQITSPDTSSVDLYIGADGGARDILNLGGGGAVLNHNAGNLTLRNGFSSKTFSFRNSGNTSNTWTVGFDTGSVTQTTAGANALAVGRQGVTNPVLNVDASTASVVTGLNIKGGAAATAPILSVTSSDAALGMVLQALTTTNSLTLNDTLAAGTSPLLAGVATDTIVGGVTDGFTGGLRLSPTINAASALTVTRHNYIDLVNPVLGGVGPAAITDSAVFRFNANAGTHKAVDSGSTKTTPTTVSAWLKVNLNGTINYIPMYTSKTS